MSRYKTYSRFTITYSDITIQVHRKNVKNLNLRVYPSEKEVKVSVPKRAPEAIVQKFIESRLPWIRKHLNKTPTEKGKPRQLFVSGETHLVWGVSVELQVIHKNEKPDVYLNDNKELILQVRPGSNVSKRKKVLNEWLREQMKEVIPVLIAKWEPQMGVSVNEFGVKRMKTRWGTCNIRDRRIWLNLELAKRRPEMLEYVVVHEMVHLLERLHNDRFYGYMTQFFPKWKSLKEELNGNLDFRDC